MDFDFDHPPRFSSSTYGQLSLTVALLLSLGLACAWLCGVLLSIDVRRARPTSSLLMANLMASNAACFLLTAVLSLPSLATSSFSLGFWGCQVEGFFIATTSEAMMWAAVWLALDRFVTVVLMRPFLSHNRYWAGLVVFGWVTSAAANSALVISQSGIAMQPDGYHCEWDYASRTPAAQPQLWINGALTSFRALVIIVLYVSMYIKVHMMQKQATADGVISARNAHSILSEEQALGPTTGADTAKSSTKAPTARQPAVAPRKASTSHQLERTVLIKVTIICSLALFTAVIQEVRVYYAQQSDASPAPVYLLTILAQFNAIFRVLVELYVVGTLDPVVRIAARRSLQSFKDIFSRRPRQ